MIIDLRRSKPNAVRRVHRLRHVIDQATDAVVDRRDRCRDDAKALIGILEDF